MNDNRVVVKFLKENIFYRFGNPGAIISDMGLISATGLSKPWCVSTLSLINYPQRITPKPMGKWK